MSDSQQQAQQVDQLELDTRTDSDADFASPRSFLTLDKSGGASEATAEGGASPSSSGLGSGYGSGEDSLQDAQPGALLSPPLTLPILRCLFKVHSAKLMWIRIYFAQVHQIWLAASLDETACDVNPGMTTSLSAINIPCNMSITAGHVTHG